VEKTRLDVPTQIAKLPSLTRQQLLELWQEIHRKPAPQGLRREILIPFLAYRIQEVAYGGLKSTTRSELRCLARDLKKASGSNAPPPKMKLRPGTRLIREWRGNRHEVTVTEAGYTYKGGCYLSLSQIACKITGTQWSGPAFFGLKKKVAPSQPR
jgi:hypothetical protein